MSCFIGLQRLYVNSDGSGVPAHARSLINAFTFSNRIVRYFRIYNNNRDSVKTAWARLPILSFFLFAYGRTALFPCYGTTIPAFCFFVLFCCFFSEKKNLKMKKICNLACRLLCLSLSLCPFVVTACARACVCVCARVCRCG